MFCYEQVQSCLFRHWFPPPEPWSFLCCSLFLRSQIIWNEEIKRGLVTTDVNRCCWKKLLCLILHRLSFDQLAAFWQPISTSLVRQLHVHKTEPRPQRLISHKLQLRESIRDITEQIRAKYTLSRCSWILRSDEIRSITQELRRGHKPAKWAKTESRT